jgi:hypothetical protein
MIAYRMELVKFDENKKDIFDQRKKFAQAVFSYRDSKGNEYRRKFQAKSFTPENEFWKIAPLEINIKNDY